jgi:hypothetical protein
MAGFLYYIPKERNPTREKLAKLGFPFAEWAAVPGCGCDKGPDGGVGAVFVLSLPVGSQPTVGHYPDTQHWENRFGGDLWVGWEREAPPRPLDLQWERAVQGKPVKLLDGNTWIVPAILNPDQTLAVEAVLRPGNNGTIRRDEPAPQYKSLWTFINRMLNTHGTSVKPTQEECVNGIASAMSMNYAVSPCELLTLGLLTEVNMFLVFGAIAGIPEEAWELKQRAPMDFAT